MRIMLGRAVCGVEAEEWVLAVVEGKLAEDKVLVGGSHGVCWLVQELDGGGCYLVNLV